MADTYTIYGLQDPRTNEYRYVGCTKDVQKRYKQHVANYVVRYGRMWSCVKAETNPKEVWVAQLADEGLQPNLVELSTATGQAEGHSVERWFIENLAAMGHSLFNMEASGRKNRPDCAFGRVLMCLAVYRNVYKFSQLSRYLEREVGYQVSPVTISSYATGRTKPKTAFNDALIRAFNLDEREQERYWIAVEHGVDTEHKGLVFFGGSTEQPERP